MNKEKKVELSSVSPAVAKQVLAADAVTKISNIALKDFYRLHILISKIDSNYGCDVNNPNMADKHHELIKEAQSICQKWINSQPPKSW